MGLVAATISVPSSPELRAEETAPRTIEIVQRPETCPSLPCAPVVPRLRLREEGRVEAGFVGE